MRVLVTGGAGFIGSHLVEHFQGRAEVRVLDNLRSGYKHNLASLQHEFIQASILDRDAVRRAMQDVDYVFHLAAMISVPESMTKPIECNEINTAGTLVVLEEAAKARVKKLVFSSSAAIYGDNPMTPKVETMLAEPKSPYAITKLDGEFYCRMFAETGVLATTSLRYFNVFGPRQDPQSQYAAVVPIFIDRAARNLPVTIHGDGDQTRDFIYVKDIVAANVFFAMHSPAIGVFNVAYGQTITIKELGQRIHAMIGSKSAITNGPARMGDVQHSHAAIGKLRAAGFTPQTNLTDGLRSTIELFTAKAAKAAADAGPGTSRQRT